ncbi:MAG: hypothetical protein ABFR53_03515 [Actinomycetota bacterium]
MDDDLRRLKDLAIDVDPSAEASERMRASLMGHIANAQLGAEIRAAVDPVEPTEMAVARMRRRLTRHIAPKAKRTHRRQGVLAALAVAALALAFVLVPLGSRDPGAVALLSIAEAVVAIPDTEFGDATIERRSDRLVLTIEPIDTPDGSISEVAFHLPIAQAERIDADGAIQVDQTAHELRFFAPVNRDVAAALNDFFSVGIAETATLPPSDQPADAGILTDDPALLGDRIHRRIDQFGPSDVPVEIQVMREIASIYKNELPTNGEKAALLTVMAETSGVALDADDPAGAVTVSALYAYDDGTRVGYSLVFSPDGWLVRETEALVDGIPYLNVPAGTAAFDTVYEPPTTAR